MTSRCASRSRTHGADRDRGRPELPRGGRSRRTPSRRRSQTIRTRSTPGRPGPASSTRRTATAGITALRLRLSLRREALRPDRQARRRRRPSTAHRRGRVRERRRRAAARRLPRAGLRRRCARTAPVLHRRRGAGRLRAPPATAFTGFEQQRVVPDIITVAKGDGQRPPESGGVITRRAIARKSPARLTGQLLLVGRRQQSSCRLPGWPCSTRCAMTACRPTRHPWATTSRCGSCRLAERHPLIGPMHGMGLCAGIELVATARRSSRRQRRRSRSASGCAVGVVVQPTSDRMNVLKVKPPLCITRESCDFVLEQLERTQIHGW